MEAAAPAVEASQRGETTTSARDTAVLLAALADRPGGGLVLAALAAALPMAADGSDQAYGLLDPAARGRPRSRAGWPASVRAWTCTRSACSTRAGATSWR